MNMQSKTIIMYHGIIADRKDLIPGHQGLMELYDVGLKDFRDHLEWIRECDRNILVTFDDGEENNFYNAFPLIREFGLKACFFIIGDKIGEPGYMNREQIKILADSGMEIGSHGMTHISLVNLDDAQLFKNLKNSKEILEKITGKQIEALSVPMGFYNGRVLRCAKNVGYKYIFSSEDFDVKDDVLPRIAIRRDWSLEYFKKALEGQVSFNRKCLYLVKKIIGNSNYQVLREFFFRFLIG